MKTNVKKAAGVLAAALILAGMAALLVTNRKRMKEQSTSEAVLDRTVPVSTVKVERARLGDGFTANGVTRAFRELTLSPDISGRVTEIYADEGERVTKGSPLLKLDDELLRADCMAAEAALVALQKDEQRLSRSSEAGGATLQQLDNIRTQLVAAQSRLAVSRRRCGDAVLKSPMDGIVNLRYAEVGALVSPSSPLFEIVDASRVKIICHVPEHRLHLLSVGQKIRAAAANAPGEDFSGRVAHIGLKSDRGLNYPVELLLDGDSRLRAGMYMKVHFCEDCGHETILIPRRAVIGSAKSPVAYAVRDGKASRRILTLGAMRGDRVEVLEGLEEGEEIIVAGLMNVGEGAELRIVSE